MYVCVCTGVSLFGLRGCLFGCVCSFACWCVRLLVGAFVWLLVFVLRVCVLICVLVFSVGALLRVVVGSYGGVFVCFACVRFKFALLSVLSVKCLFARVNVSWFIGMGVLLFVCCVFVWSSVCMCVCTGSCLFMCLLRCLCCVVRVCFSCVCLLCALTRLIVR